MTFKVDNVAKPEIPRVRDIGPYGLWTTIVVKPNHPADRPLRGFHYSIGMPVPGFQECACRGDTNLNVAGCVVDEEMAIEVLTWRLPALSLGKYQQGGKDYHITPEDAAAFAKVRLSLHIGEHDIPIPTPLVLVPDASGGYGGSFKLIDETKPLPKKKDKQLRVDIVEMEDLRKAYALYRLDNFWVEMSFPEGTPAIGGAVSLIVTVDGKRCRGVS